ncbi:hypothetical protein V6N12_045851 [Hibiscus sabdariffa]|uniref:Uncharacterized protein n=1 Tax=Hibiscus sabdariffa TaxID=183260 RepID=A0ABR2G3X8_9ROSI
MRGIYCEFVTLTGGGVRPSVMMAIDGMTEGLQILEVDKTLVPFGRGNSIARLHWSDGSKVEACKSRGVSTLVLSRRSQYSHSNLMHVQAKFSCGDISRGEEASRCSCRDKINVVSTMVVQLLYNVLRWSIDAYTKPNVEVDNSTLSGEGSTLM